MSDKPDINSQIVEIRGHLQAMPSHYGLMKVNRLLLAIVVSLMTLVLLLGFFLLPDQEASVKKITSATHYRAEMSPILSAEVDALKGQMVGLVSGSIESKLRILEQSIRLGSVTNSLGTIEDLKNDVKVLRSYSEPAVTVKDDKTAIVNEQLLQEMSQLKKLIYVSLASCGLMLAAVAGIWLKNLNRLTYKKVITSYLNKH